MAREIVVIGAGIVGICVARTLVREGVKVTVPERVEGKPLGSTAFAPGFVGLYNDVTILTDLARASAEIYSSAEAGFVRGGGRSRRAMRCRESPGPTDPTRNSFV